MLCCCYSRLVLHLSLAGKLHLQNMCSIYFKGTGILILQWAIKYTFYIDNEGIGGFCTQPHCPSGLAKQDEELQI